MEGASTTALIMILATYVPAMMATSCWLTITAVMVMFYFVLLPSWHCLA